MIASVPHDFYQLPGYVKLCANQEGDSARALALTAEENGAQVLIPLIARDVPGATDAWDAASPYGYSGILVSGAADPEAFAQRALDEARHFLAEQGCVSLFLRLHPLLGPAPHPAGGV